MRALQTGARTLARVWMGGSSLVFLLLLGGCSTTAQFTIEPEKSPQKPAASDTHLSAKGWNYLASKLIADGIPRARVDKIFNDHRMPPFGFIPFSVQPREASGIYSQFLRSDKLSRARQFIKLHKQTFDSAEHHFNVTRAAIVSILLVETDLGRFTGNNGIFERLTRVASVNAPNNCELNLIDQRKKGIPVELPQVQARAQYLEDTFYPEIPALIRLADREQWDLFEIRGSSAGAFGLPQFLPSSYNRFAADGDNDGHISLFNPKDAIYSVANYLAQIGWRDSASYEEKYKVIWHYNHSAAYVATVLQLTKVLSSPSPHVAATTASTTKKTTPPVTKIAKKAPHKVRKRK